MLGEFLTANVSTPFILFMVKSMFHRRRRSCDPDSLRGFNQFDNEAEIAFWTGILGMSRLFTVQSASPRIDSAFSSLLILSDPIHYIATLGMRFACLVCSPA